MSDINIQTFSGKVSVKNDLRVGQGHLFVDTAANQVGLNSLTPQANLHVTGNTYVTSDLRVGSKVVIDSSAADSNVLVITGGGIKADFILGDGRSQWTTTGNDVYYTGGVAIGSSQTPTTALDVTGSGTFSGDLTAAFLHGDGSNISNITSSQWTTVNMNELYYTLGNVGIGNQNPNYTLDVTGDINFTGDLYQNGTIFSGGGGGGGSGFWQAGTGTKIYYSAGEVGIANTNPQHTLSVGSNLYVEDAGSNVLVVDGNVACTQLTLGQFEIVPSYGLGDVTAESNVTTDTVELNNATTGLSTVSNVVVGGELTVSGNAAVSSNLTVSGNVTVSKDVTVTEDLTVSGNVTVGTADLFVDTVNSRVGIGTDNPTGGLLHVNGAVYSTSLVSEGTTDSVLTIRNTSTPAIIRTLATGGQTYIQSGTVATSDSRADINFTSMYDGTNFMKIQGSSGNVGIGTVSPDYKLHVSGGVSYFPDGISTPGYHAQMVLSGGGNVTWDGSNLLWSYRIIALPIEKTEFGALGYINIDCPTTGTITSYNGDGTTGTVTCTSSGVPFTDWTALWYVVTPGQSQASDQTKFVLTDYRNGDWRPDSNWLLIATKNGDSQSQYGLKFMPTNSTHYTWIAPSFSDSWVNYDSTYNSAAYYKDSENRVHLRGLVKDGLLGHTRTIFTLPVGFRPVRRELFCVMTNANVAGRIDIPPDGRVIPYSVNAAWVSLDNLSFTAM